MFKIKNTFLMICISGSISFCSAQQMQVTLTSDTLIYGNTLFQSFYGTCDVQNFSLNDSLYVDLIRLQNDVGINWASGMCLDVCMYINQDSGRRVIAPLTTKEFKMYFMIVSHNSDTAHTQILFRNVVDTSNYFVQEFYAVDTSYLTPVSEVPFMNEILTILPNPAINWLSINYSGILNEPSDFSIYNSLGKKIFSFKFSEAKREINISEYPRGLYVAEFKNRHFKFVKF